MSLAEPDLALMRLFAHAGIPPAPHDAWSAWSLEPVVVALLVICGAAYVHGVRRTWRATGRGRVIPIARVRLAMLACAALVLALISPIDAIGSALFSLHMVQHLLLIAVVAPLLVAGDVGNALFRALPLRVRRATARAARSAGVFTAWRGLTHPLPAWTLHAALLWFWHVPVWYDAAVYDGVLHALEHTTLLGSAVLFWVPVLSPRSQRRAPEGIAILYLFTFAVQSALFGAVLTFASEPWYEAHARWTAAWGLTPLEDQQLAGSIMWVPGGLVYLLAAGRLFVRWIRQLDGTTPPLAREVAE